MSKNEFSLRMPKPTEDFNMSILFTFPVELFNNLFYIYCEYNFGCLDFHTKWIEEMVKYSGVSLYEYEYNGNHFIDSDIRKIFYDSLKKKYGDNQINIFNKKILRYIQHNCSLYTFQTIFDYRLNYNFIKQDWADIIENMVEDNILDTWCSLEYGVDDKILKSIPLRHNYGFVGYFSHCGWIKYLLEYNQKYYEKMKKIQRDKAIHSIQKQWKLCRYRTEYQTCRNIVNRELDELGVDFQ